MMPLFPLGTVLFPGGSLPLRIFEARYLDMISNCLKSGEAFGVNLIRSGAEVGAPADCRPVGTLARIDDWQSLPGGLLGITVSGGERYRVVETSVQPDNLLLGEVEWLPDGDGPAPEEIGTGRYAWVPPLLEGMQPGVDASSVIGTGQLSFRLAEYLGLPIPLCQQLLELDDEYTRLDRLFEYLQPNSAGS